MGAAQPILADANRARVAVHSSGARFRPIAQTIHKHIPATVGVMETSLTSEPKTEFIAAPREVLMAFLFGALAAVLVILALYPTGVRGGDLFAQAPGPLTARDAVLGSGFSAGEGGALVMDLDGAHIATAAAELHEAEGQISAFHIANRGALAGDEGGVAARKAYVRLGELERRARAARTRYEALVAARSPAGAVRSPTRPMAH